MNLDNKVMYIWAVRSDEGKCINREIEITNSSDINEVESIVTPERLQVGMSTPNWTTFIRPVS